VIVVSSVLFLICLAWFALPGIRAALQVLGMLASGLPKLDRVSFYTEDAFEARLIHGDAARELVVSDMVAGRNRRMRYLYASTNPIRARRHVLWLQERYGGQCQRRPLRSAGSCR
jgi:hypothetical protein